MTGKTIGTTTLASTGGGAVGFFVAQFIVDIFHLQLTDGGQMGLGLLLVAVGSLIGGYLSPSKHEELTRVFAEANIPSASEIATQTAQEVAKVVPAHEPQNIVITPQSGVDAEKVASKIGESVSAYQAHLKTVNALPDSIAPASVAASKVEYSSGSLASSGAQRPVVRPDVDVIDPLNP